MKKKIVVPQGKSPEPKSLTEIWFEAGEKCFYATMPRLSMVFRCEVVTPLRGLGTLMGDGYETTPWWFPAGERVWVRSYLTYE